MKRVERSYTIRQKRQALAVVGEVGIEDAARQLKIARGTIHGRTKQADGIINYKSHATSKPLKGQGRKEKFPGISDLLTYMKDTRHAEAVRFTATINPLTLSNIWFMILEDVDLSTAGMIEFMRKIHPQWMDSYLSEKDNGELALERTVHHLDNRYGFTSQKPQAAKNSYELLEEVRAKFAIEFWEKYALYANGGMMNVDETAILFDMPPIKSWAGRGRKDAARILGANKHAGRMTAVLTVNDNGDKLPIPFAIRGVRGGKIEEKEFESYPDGQFCALQESAWMDKQVWQLYVEKLLKFEIDGPTVLVLDNFDCHVSEEGQGIVAEQANATVVPLPPNSTAVCQPLDVGVMGPPKAKLRHSAKCIRGTAKEKRLRAITSTIAAWEAISKSTIICSFEKAIPQCSEVTV